MFDREPVEKGDGDRRANPVDVHVGGRIAPRRRSLGLSQSDLGQALGLTFQQIQKYERGANRVSASRLWKAAGFLGVSVSYFFEKAWRRPVERQRRRWGLRPRGLP